MEGGVRAGEEEAEVRLTAFGVMLL